MPTYKEVIRLVEQVWCEHGADVTCRECIASPRGGCCQLCPNLGPKGCTEKPLCCAIWTCHIIDKKHPVLAKKLRQLQELGITNGYRLSGFEVFNQIPEKRRKEELVQIQLALTNAQTGPSNPVLVSAQSGASAAQHATHGTL